MDIHASRRHNHILLAPLKIEMAALSGARQVACMKPAFGVSQRLDASTPDAGRDVVASNQDLAVGGNLHFHTRQLFSDRATLWLEGMRNADERCGLGHAVALHHRKSKVAPERLG